MLVEPKCKPFEEKKNSFVFVCAHEFGFGSNKEWEWQQQ